MAVYSCSPRTNLHLRVEACAPSCRERLINRELNVPCLYLGDYEASNDKNWELLMNHLEDTAGYPPLEGLGRLQAPHHGSHRNFRDEFVSGGFLSVIPAKLNQAHPSAKVLMKYIENNVDPYVVTDVDETLLELRVDS